MIKIELLASSFIARNEEPQPILSSNTLWLEMECASEMRGGHADIQVVVGARDPRSE